tara:strand:- start:510 stop:662 length:153 start_codon:yes stop_codon:yes gene_type:complete
MHKRKFLKKCLGLLALIPGFNIFIINKKSKNNIIVKKKFSKIWFLDINDI